MAPRAPSDTLLSFGANHRPMEEWTVVSKNRDAPWLVGAMGAGVLFIVVGAVSVGDSLSDSSTMPCTVGMFVVGALLIAYGALSLRKTRAVVTLDSISYFTGIGGSKVVRWESLGLVRIIDTGRPVRAGFTTAMSSGRFSAMYFVAKNGQPLLNIQTPEDMDTESYQKLEDLVADIAAEKGVEVVRKEAAGRKPD